MTTPMMGQKQERVKDQAVSPWKLTGRVEIGYFGDQPLSHVRLVGACGETIDEYWVTATEARRMLRRLVEIRQGQKR